MHVRSMYTFGCYATQPANPQPANPQPANLQPADLQPADPRPINPQDRGTLSVQEDVVSEQLDGWSEFQRATAYWLLHRRYGMTVDDAQQIRSRVYRRIL